jgi:hypothetical protein
MWKWVVCVLGGLAMTAVVGFLLLVGAANERCGDAAGKWTPRQERICTQIKGAARFCNGCYDY